MLEEQFRKEILLELENLDQLCKEVHKVLEQSRTSAPDNILKAALGTYLAQFYNGVENILKRIAKGKSVNLPKSEQWHRELFLMFCANGHNELPVLFEGTLVSDMTAFRKFRHVVFHGYSFTLDWEIIAAGAARIDTIYNNFKRALQKSGLIS